MTIDASRRGYHLFAPIYDAVFGLSLQHGRKLAIEALGCRPGDYTLEIGVGSGLSLPLYPSGVTVSGIDTSRAMLVKAARRVKRHRLSCIVRLFEMDAGRLAFADASFDKAAVLYALPGLPDPEHATREIRRVCRPGALIVIAGHFLSRTATARVCDGMLAPLYQLLRYRVDLDMDAFVTTVGLEIVETRPANLFGYSTVLVCRNQ